MIYDNLVADTPNASPYVVELPAPPRGVINRFTVKQTSGALGGYTYAVYNRQEAAAGSADTYDAAVHQVVDLQTVAGAASTSQLFQKSYSYSNQDTQDDRGMPTSKLYLTITGGSGKDFDIGYTITGPSLT